MNRSLDPDLRRQALVLRREGLSTLAIADALGIGKSTAWNYTRKLGLDARSSANKARADAPPDWLPRARAMMKAGIARNAIAKQLGLPRSVVYRGMARFTPP